MVTAVSQPNPSNWQDHPLAARLRQRAIYLYEHKQRRISRQDHLDMLRASIIINRLAPVVAEMEQATWPVAPDTKETTR